MVTRRHSCPKRDFTGWRPVKSEDDQSERGTRKEQGRESSSSHVRAGVIFSMSVVSMSEVKVGVDESESKVREGGCLEEGRVMAGSAVGGVVLRVELRPWQ